jgi:hypothetical protein
MGYEAPAAQEKDRAIKKFSNSLAALSDYARRKNPSGPLTISVENFCILAQEKFEHSNP